MSTISCLTSQKDAKNGLFNQSVLKKNWYVFYTAPRAEKVVQQLLNNKGFEVFLPVRKTLKVWKNRQKKMIDQVLFPSYIFVNTEEHNLHTIKGTSKIVTYIHCAGKPCIVNLSCIEGIKKMLSLDQEITSEPGFFEGDFVKILYGPLAGYVGILDKRKTKTRFGIQLKEINQTAFIDICTSQIAIIN